MPHALVQRARIIVACVEGRTNTEVAARVGASPSAIGKWRPARFLERSVQGLHDELRPGQPQTYDNDKVAGLINRALQHKPDHANAWSVRLMAEAEGSRRAQCSAGSRCLPSSRTAAPFVWVAMADSIFQKLERLSARICGTPY